MGRIEEKVTRSDLREEKEKGSNETLFQLKYNRFFFYNKIIVKYEG